MISTSFRWVCDWYVLDTFSVDLQSLDLITTPAVNVETGVDCYNSTVRALLDKHAFVELKHNKTCSSSVQWHDRECHDVKHHIRKLEWQYHRLCTVESKTVWYPAVWHTVSAVQVKMHRVLAVIRQLLLTKSKCTMANCQHVASAIKKVHLKLSADRFIQFFRGKVNISTWTATLSADPPVIVSRKVPPLSHTKPVTVTHWGSASADVNYIWSRPD